MNLKKVYQFQILNKKGNHEMRNVTILSSSLRNNYSFKANEISNNTDYISVPRKKYEVKVPKHSLSSSLAYAIKCKIQDKYDDLHYLDHFKLRTVKPCIACYNCVKEGKCFLDDTMTESIYEYLEKTQELVIISPLYYGTISPHLMAFFTRLYKYWIKSVNINERTGFPNEYPKMNVTAIGVCADPWQNWKVFDDTLLSIFKEIGWNFKGIFHTTDKNQEIIDQVYTTILKEK